MVKVEIDMKVSGHANFREFSAMFNSFAKLCRDAIEVEAERHALKIQEYMRMFAPSEEKGSVLATGKLKRSIRIHKLARTKDAVRFRLYVSAVSHTGFDYPRVQEFGTKTRKAKGTMKWRLPSGVYHDLPYGLMVFRANVGKYAGQWIAKRTVRGVGKGKIGRKTVHFMMRGFALGLKEFDEYIRHKLFPSEMDLEKFWKLKRTK